MSRETTPPHPGDAVGVPADEVATAEQADPLTVARTPPLRILVTGADGFLGSHLLPRLVSRGHQVRAVHRGGVGPGRRAAPGLDWREADVTDAESLAGLASACDGVIHMAGLFSSSDDRTLERVNAGGTRNLLSEARESGVARFVYVSVLGASPSGGAFFRSKFQAEDAVMSSGLEYVILRPSVIYGPGDYFTTAVVRLLRGLPVFPMLGDGTFRIQPVAVEDMADALAQAVERDDVAGGLFDLAGPERLSFSSVVRIIGETIGRPRAIIRFPALLAPGAAWLADRLGWPTPFTPDQLDILRCGSELGSGVNPLRSVFRLKPLPFRDAVADYLESVGEQEGGRRGRQERPS